MSRKRWTATAFAASTVLITACAFYDEEGDDVATNPPEPTWDSGNPPSPDGGPCGDAGYTCVDAAPPDAAPAPDAAAPIVLDPAAPAAEPSSSR